MNHVQIEPWSIRPNTGGTLQVGDVVGRDDFILGLLDDMAHGADVLLVDPRRMGKTMILRRLCNSPGERFEAAVMIDLEGATSTRECFERITRALGANATLWDRTKKVVGSYVDSASLELGIVKVNAVASDRSPVELLSGVIEAVDRKLVDDGRQLIVALDEVPIAVDLILANEGKQAAQQFLHMVRHLQSSSEAIRWLLAGSMA